MRSPIAIPTRCVGLLVTTIVLGSVGPADAQGCAPAPPGIIAWWKADGDAANRMGSPAGVARNGATFAAGKVDQALSLDGATGFVEVPDDDRWTFGTRDFTIELWANFRSVRASSIGSPAAVLIGHDEGSFSRNKWFFALGGGVLNFHVNGPSLGPMFLVRAPFVPALGQWYHLALTRRAGVYTVYVDGVAQAAETNATAIPDASAPLTIGQAEGLGFMDGLIDEVTIYDGALDGEQLRTIALAAGAGKCSSSAPAVFGDFRFGVGCPATARQGETVTARLAFTNGTPKARTASSVAVALHRGGLSIVGPTRVPVDLRIDAASLDVAPCAACAPAVVATSAARDVEVRVPSARAGTFVSFGFSVLGHVGEQPGRRVLATGACTVEIVR